MLLRRLSLALALASFGLAPIHAQQIFMADFNTGLPVGWTILNGGTTPDTWYITPATGFNNQSLNGSAFAFVNSDAVPATPARTLSEQLKSPVFNGLAYGQVFLEFDQYYRDYSNDTGWVEVYNGTTWVPVANYSANSGAWNAPAHITINLTAYRNNNMQVRFRYEDRGIWAWYWGVDNVQMYAPSPWDASVTAFNPPAGTCGLGSNEPVSIEIRNDGTAIITSLPVSYQVNGGAVVTETMTGSIAPNGTMAYTFATGVNMSAAGQYTFKAWCALPSDTDLAGDTISGISRKNHILVNTYPYVQDFEANNGSWFASGTNSTWAWGTPAKTVIQGAASGQKAWMTGGLAGDYVNNEHSQIEGPCFDLSTLNGPWFGTDIWWNCEFSWDGAALQSSIDGGQTWQTIGAFNNPYNWYNDNTIDGAPGGQNNGWSGRTSSNNGSTDWVRAAHSMANLSGNNEVILRIAFGSDGSVIDDGIAFDRITIAAQPVLYLGPDTIACDSFRIQGGAFAQYAWSTNDTTPSILVTQTGNYSLDILDQYGFPSGDLIHVEIQGPGNWTLGPDTFFCQTLPYPLEGPMGASAYAWSTGDQTQQISAITSGNYVVSATYSAGCSASDTVSILFSSLNASTGLASDTLCRGSILQFPNASTGASSWWWDFGNGNFSSSASPNTVYVSGGTYQLTLIVGDGQCSDTASQVVFVDVCTGMEEGFRPSLSVQPNPMDAQATISGSAWPAGEVSWELISLQGQVMQKGNTAVQQGEWLHRLDVRGLASGLYFFKAFQDGISTHVPIQVRH